MFQRVESPASHLSTSYLPVIHSDIVTPAPKNVNIRNNDVTSYGGASIADSPNLHACQPKYVSNYFLLFLGGSGVKPPEIF